MKYLTKTISFVFFFHTNDDWHKVLPRSANGKSTSTFRKMKNDLSRIFGQRSSLRFKWMLYNIINKQKNTWQGKKILKFYFTWFIWKKRNTSSNRSECLSFFSNNPLIWFNFRMNSFSHVLFSITLNHTLNT